MQTIGTFTTRQLSVTVPYHVAIQQKAIAAQSAISKIAARIERRLQPSMPHMPHMPHLTKAEKVLWSASTKPAQAGGLRFITPKPIDSTCQPKESQKKESQPQNTRKVAQIETREALNAKGKAITVYTVACGMITEHSKAGCMRAIAAAGFTHYQMNDKVAIIPKAYRIA